MIGKGVLVERKGVADRHEIKVCTLDLERPLIDRSAFWAHPLALASACAISGP